MADVREMETESTMVCFHPPVLTGKYLCTFLLLCSTSTSGKEKEEEELFLMSL